MLKNKACALNYRRYFYIKHSCFLFSFLILLYSCKGQNNKPADKVSADKSKLISSWQTGIIKANDKDPYFIENKDSVSAYGPYGIIRNLMQDKNGNIWLASYTGIVQNRDNVFTNLTNIEGLRRYRIFSVMEDKKGFIWFGTVGAGVFRYDASRYNTSGPVRIFSNLTTSDGLIDNKVECMLEDKAGNTWFGTGNGISYYDGKKFHNFTTEDGLVDADVHAIIQDKKGKIWVGALGGVFYYDPAAQLKGKPAFTPFPNITGKPFNNVRTIIEDKKGNIWIGGQEGLFKYDGQMIKKQLSDFTGNLYADSKGNIWFSAGTGNKTGNMSLNKYTGETIPLAAGSLNFTQIKKEDGQVFGITEDTEGNIWYGTFYGVCRYDGKTFNYFKKTK